MLSVLRRVVLAATAAASIAVAAAAAATVRADHVVVGALFVAALVWAAVPPVADLLTDRPPRRNPQPEHRSAKFTSVIRVGDEPIGVARTSIVLTAAAGPTIVATTGRHDLTELLELLEVPCCVAGDMETAVHDATLMVTTPALLLLSASAVPRPDACRAAVARLDERVGWVIGRTEVFNDDGYAPEGRERFASALRSRARRNGLDLWERDAVIVRSDLVQAHPPRPGRPWGAWLRRMGRWGLVGAEHPALLTRRASPAGADAYWSATITRKRATAADLGDGLATTRGLARLSAASLLLRELHAYPLLVWASSPVLIDATGAFPLRWSAAWFSAAAVGAAVLRWAVARWAAGVPLHPATDAMAATYDIPGSLLALPAAVTRVVRPSRLHLPDRPLTWLLLLLTLLLASPLLGKTQDVPATALVGALVLLSVVWALATQALLQRTWERATYRFALEVPVCVDGEPAMTVDASPSGVAVSGAFPAVSRGDSVDVLIRPADATPMQAAGTVVYRHRQADREVLGLTLGMHPEEQARWVRLLFSHGGAATPLHPAAQVSNAAPTVRARLVRAGERAVLALVSGMAVLAIAAVVMVLLGYRPLVVRSGSMVPALRVGDLAIVEDVPAGALRVDDIVTFPDPEDRGDTVTHRVRDMAVQGGDILFETQGDANASSEHWSARSDQVLGRYAWRVPAVGRALVALSQPLVRAALIGTAAVAAALYSIEALRRRVAAG